ncbi:MAG: hypothetical protein ABSH56_30220 [Bryobacteraceae bacterium]|jgi:hypothetical protein
MIQPQSVTLLAGASQQFTEPAATHWDLSPTFGQIDANGLYRAPRNVWISRTIDVAASAGGGVIGRATVTISSARTWMTVLGLFWTALSIVLLVSLFLIWPSPAPTPSVAVYPPVATLQANDTLQFLGSATGAGPAALIWTADQGQITPAGVFTAPTAAVSKPIQVNAARESDRAETATAQVYIHARKLVMDKSVVDATGMPSGATLQFRGLGPAGPETGLQWYLSGPGSLSPTGVYTVRDKSAEEAVVTAVDPVGGRQAAAVIKLISGTRDDHLLLLVLVMGAFGALLGAMRSFVNFVGSRTFVPSWGFYYLSRPVFGGGLALIVFFAYRIGAITGPQGAAPADPFAAAFIAGVVGLFADTFLQKLQELITQLFRPSDTRADKMGGGSPAPAISALAVNAGNLTVTGANFAGAGVTVNGTELHPSAATATSLTVALPDALAARGTELKVIVHNADGVKSSVMSVTV